MYFKITLIILLLIFLPTSFFFAESEKWGTPYDTFFERNDLNPEYKRSENGEETRSVTVPNLTKIEQVRKDGKVSTYTVDISGLGGVLCARSMYQITKIVFQNCDDLKSPLAEKGLATALQKIDQFILENSVTPVSLQDLKAEYERNTAEFKKTFSDGKPRICKPRLSQDDTLRLVEGIAQSFEPGAREEDRAYLDKLLSVPRLPVINPCF